MKSMTDSCGREGKDSFHAEVLLSQMPTQRPGQDFGVMERGLARLAGAKDEMVVEVTHARIAFNPKIAPNRNLPSRSCQQKTANDILPTINNSLRTAKLREHEFIRQYFQDHILW
jgi:hypothetical protein